MSPLIEQALAHGPVGDELHAVLQPEESVHEAKTFLVRAWLAPDATGEPPGAISWLMASTSLGEAESRVRPLRTILHHLLAQDDETRSEETAAVEAEILARIHLLPAPDAMRVLSDIGVPSFFNASFQDPDEILVIPFTTLTGFSEGHVERLSALAPRPETVPPDPFKHHRF